MLFHLDLKTFLLRCEVRCADLNLRDNQGKTCVHYAAIGGHDSVMQLFSARGANFELQDRFGMTCLHAAASKGHLSIVKFLLTKGLNSNQQDGKSRMAFFHAVAGGHVSVVQFLVSHGVDVKQEDSVEMLTVLDHASKLGRHAIVKCLVANGAELSLNVVELAVQSKSDSMVEFLVAHGAPVNALALRSAVMSSASDSIVGLLIDNGADLHAKHESQTVLHLAAKKGFGSTVDLLVSKGADMEAKDKFGQTALHSAAANANDSTVGALIARGADMEAKTFLGQTALDLAHTDGVYAAENAQHATIEVLVRHGADLQNKVHAKSEIMESSSVALENDTKTTPPSNLKNAPSSIKLRALTPDEKEACAQAIQHYDQQKIHQKDTGETSFEQVIHIPNHPSKYVLIPSSHRSQRLRMVHNLLGDFARLTLSPQLIKGAAEVIKKLNCCDQAEIRIDDFTGILYLVADSSEDLAEEQLQPETINSNSQTFTQVQYLNELYDFAGQMMKIASLMPKTPQDMMQMSTSRLEVSATRPVSPEDILWTTGIFLLMMLRKDMFFSSYFWPKLQHRSTSTLFVSDPESKFGTELEDYFIQSSFHERFKMDSFESSSPAQRKWLYIKELIDHVVHRQNSDAAHLLRNYLVGTDPHWKDDVTQHWVHIHPQQFHQKATDFFLQNLSLLFPESKAPLAMKFKGKLSMIEDFASDIICIDFDADSGVAYQVKAAGKEKIVKIGFDERTDEATVLEALTDFELKTKEIQVLNKDVPALVRVSEPHKFSVALQQTRGAEDALLNGIQQGSKVWIKSIKRVGIVDSQKCQIVWTVEGHWEGAECKVEVPADQELRDRYEQDEGFKEQWTLRENGSDAWFSGLVATFGLQQFFPGAEVIIQQADGPDFLGSLLTTTNYLEPVLPAVLRTLSRHTAKGLETEYTLTVADMVLPLHVDRCAKPQSDAEEERFCFFATFPNGKTEQVDLRNLNSEHFHPTVTPGMVQCNSDANLCSMSKTSLGESESENITPVQWYNRHKTVYSILIPIENTESEMTTLLPNGTREHVYPMPGVQNEFKVSECGECIIFDNDPNGLYTTPVHSEWSTCMNWYTAISGQITPEMRLTPKAGLYMLVTEPSKWQFHISNIHNYFAEREKVRNNIGWNFFAERFANGNPQEILGHLDLTQEQWENINVRPLGVGGQGAAFLLDIFGMPQKQVLKISFDHESIETEVANLRAVRAAIENHPTLTEEEKQTGLNGIQTFSFYNKQQQGGRMVAYTISPFCGQHTWQIANTFKHMTGNKHLSIVYDWTVQLFKILHVLHQLEFDVGGETIPFAHRSLKPNDLVIDDDGRLRIIDFGLSSGVVRASPGASMTIFETPDLLNCDREIRNNYAFDGPADMWHLGMVLAMLLSNEPRKHPFPVVNLFASLFPYIYGLKEIVGDSKKDVSMRTRVREALAGKDSWPEHVHEYLENSPCNVDGNASAVDTLKWDVLRSVIEEELLVVYDATTSEMQRPSAGYLLESYMMEIHPAWLVGSTWKFYEPMKFHQKASEFILDNASQIFGSTNNDNGTQRMPGNPLIAPKWMLGALNYQTQNKYLDGAGFLDEFFFGTTTGQDCNSIASPPAAASPGLEHTKSNSGVPVPNWQISKPVQEAIRAAFREALVFRRAGFYRQDGDILGVQYEVEILLTDWQRKVQYALTERVTIGFSASSDNAIKMHFSSDPAAQQNDSAKTGAICAKRPGMVRLLCGNNHMHFGIETLNFVRSELPGEAKTEIMESSSVALENDTKTTPPSNLKNAPSSLKF